MISDARLPDAQREAISAPHSRRIAQSYIPPPVPTPPPPRQSQFRPPPKPPLSPATTHDEEMAAEEPDQWMFSELELDTTPSIRGGLSILEERTRRAKGVNFLVQAGMLLRLPQITLTCASVFLHRLYMRCSMIPEKGGIHHYVSGIFAACGCRTDSLNRRALPLPSSWLPKPKKTPARRRKSSLPLHAWHKRMPIPSSTHNRKNTGGGVTIS